MRILYVPKPTTIINTPHYGLLYNQLAVQSGLLAITGWRIPTDTDFHTLISTVGSDTICGSALKSTGTSAWLSPNTGATNSSGFSALPGGQRWRNPGVAVFSELNQSAYFWTSVNTGIGSFYALGLSYNSTGLIQQGGYTQSEPWTGLFASTGASIRCIKNSTTLTNGQSGTYVDYDGNHYSTICIGTQEWLQQNLKVTHYNNGTPITLCTDASTWAAYATALYCYYNNDITLV